MSGKNLMKASNLGVCFGPTLMRPEHETVASIVDIRYQNIIVETLIQQYDRVRPHPFPCSSFYPIFYLYLVDPFFLILVLLWFYYEYLPVLDISWL